MLNRWLNKPSKERNRLLLNKVEKLPTLPFHLGYSSTDTAYVTYQPDSYAIFNNHTEYEDLRKRFIANNKFNNAGDIPRLWSFVLNLKQVMNEDVPGDLAELGVWRGNTAAILAYFAAKHGRRVQLFDTFEGFDAKDLKGIDSNKKLLFNDTSVGLVRDVIGEDSSACDFVTGYFPASIEPRHSAMSFCAVSLDCDLYEPMRAGLEFFYPRLTKGGIFFLHDYSSGHWDGCKQAIDEFCAESGEMLILMPDKSGSAFIRKHHH